MVSKRIKLQGLGHAPRGLVLAVALAISACAPIPPREAARPATAPPPAPTVEVFFYPTRGQSPEQQDRDRYECYLWARDQTGYDPSAPQLAPSQQVRVEPALPPGQETAAGAVAGAVLGAAVSRRGEKTEGAVKGAITGAILGAASEAARAEEAQRLEQEQQYRLDAERAARLEQQASRYRRAMAACLEGRGYKVR